VDAEGALQRRHAVLQRSRTSEAFRTSTIGDLGHESSSQMIISHLLVGVKDFVLFVSAR
jgi:hypothetical protein